MAVDASDHVWVLHRPWSLTDDEKAQNPEAPCCTAAPPVLEFDADGRYLRGWGGPGAGYEWPEDEHAIHVDHKRNVWITSAGGPRLAGGKENQILKFTSDGTFLLQIGRRGMSQGSLDTANVNNAADLQVDPATNELYVADGYVNRRVIVFDADTGAFKRMWGAYGKPPDDAAPRTASYDGPAAGRSSPWCTASACRATARSTSPTGATTACRCSRPRASSSARSSSSARRSCSAPRSRSRSRRIREQRVLYLADAGNGRVHLYDRATLKEAGVDRPHRPLRRPVRLPPRAGHRFARQPLHGGSRDRAAGAEVREPRRAALTRRGARRERRRLLVPPSSTSRRHPGEGPVTASTSCARRLALIAVVGAERAEHALIASPP